MIRFTLVAALVPSLASASIGQVVVAGEVATRTPKGGAPEVLRINSAIELGDTVDVKKGNLKLMLTDQSVIMLSQGSKLEITEAEFQGQERGGFSAMLFLGKLWTKVKKAAGGAKFEVRTERAVAGVRGTIFRIDADTLVGATKTSKGRRATIVRVRDGVVRVAPTKKVAQASKVAPGKAALPKAAADRKQIDPPFQEVSADQWEALFEDLQANQQIAVGVDLWDLAPIDGQTDPFGKWIDANQ